MDTVILAAGRGARLRGVAAPFHKPFMVVGGRSLIVNAVELALAEFDDHVIVVAAPGNVVPMIDLLRDAVQHEFHRLRFIVQPDPEGPGAAFLRAAELDLTDQVMVLLADNVLDPLDVSRVASVAKNATGAVIGIREVPKSAMQVAARFTRILPDLSTVEGPFVTEVEVWDSGFFRCWVGPLVVPVPEFIDVLMGADDEDELKLGRHLGMLTNPAKLVHVDSYDVGDPIVVEDL